jgi:catechol-2,3-dioxygenase
LVGDVEKCARFYRNVFGFTALPSKTRDWSELEIGGCPAGLKQTARIAGSSSV